MWWHNTYIEAAVPSVPCLPLPLLLFLLQAFDRIPTLNRSYFPSCTDILNRTLTVYSNCKPHIYNLPQCLRLDLLLGFHLRSPRTTTSLSPMRLLRVCLDPQTTMKSRNHQAPMTTTNSTTLRHLDPIAT